MADGGSWPVAMECTVANKGNESSQSLALSNSNTSAAVKTPCEDHVPCRLLASSEAQGEGVCKTKSVPAVFVLAVAQLLAHQMTCTMVCQMSRAHASTEEQRLWNGALILRYLLPPLRAKASATFLLRPPTVQSKSACHKIICPELETLHKRIEFRIVRQVVMRSATPQLSKNVVSRTEGKSFLEKSRISVNPILMMAA